MINWYGAVALTVCCYNVGQGSEFFHGVITGIFWPLWIVIKVLETRK